MNIPNILTIFRILLILPFIYFFQANTLSGYIISFFIYLLASLTDYFDGFLARKLNQVSQFGAFFDPLADKILVLTIYTLISIKKLLYIPFIFVILIGFRDYFTTLMRVEIERKDKNSIKIGFKTSFKAKFKTGFQMFTIILFFILIFIQNRMINVIKYNKLIVYYILPLLCISLSTILAYTSAIDYIKKYINIAKITFTKTITTFFYLGYFPYFPGTFVSLVFLVLVLILKINTFWLTLLLIFSIIIGIIFSNYHEKIENKKDPSEITIDEISGLLIVLLFINIFYEKNILNFNYISSRIIPYFINLKMDIIIILFIIGYTIFRIYDIFKPFGIKTTQKLKGGLGVIIDDLVAGVYSFLTVFLIIYILNLIY